MCLQAPLVAQYLGMWPDSAGMALRRDPCWDVQPVTSDEGGVAAGFAVLDSPYLLDD